MNAKGTGTLKHDFTLFSFHSWQSAAISSKEALLASPPAHQSAVVQCQLYRLSSPRLPACLQRRHVYLRSAQPPMHHLVLGSALDWTATRSGDAIDVIVGMTPWVALHNERGGEQSGLFPSECERKASVAVL